MILQAFQHNYVSLVYRFACTAFVISMGSLVISTILKTRSLHNIHNILVVNLMVADIVGVVIYAFQNIGMTLLYIIGIQDPFRCDVFRFFNFHVIVIMYTLVMLSVEKFIGIKYIYALRYKAINTHHRIYRVIAAGWIIGPLFKLTALVYDLIVGAEYDKPSRFSFCFAKQCSFLGIIFSPVLPIFLAFFITITLDVYLSIKAYQIYKRIQRENEEQKQMSQDKLNGMLHQLKPIITLLVTILGNTTIAVIVSIIYTSTSTVEGPSFLKHVILPNLPYLDLSLHTLVYGLYFKKICQPLCRRLKRMVRSCKFNKQNSTSPGQAYIGRSVQRAWM